MPNQGLSTATEADLKLANSAAVESAFGGLDRYTKNDRWLGLNNRYARGSTERIRKDFASSSIDEKHLTEYVAASVPAHTTDGWTYLGRALSAHLNGDYRAARHMSYYAELRASMAILASQGIGVFDRHHFVVTGKNQVAHVHGAGSTHVFAWNALEWWGGQSTTGSVVGDSLRPFQRPLSTWFDNTPKYSSWAPVAYSWIRMLGVDLAKIAKDQYSRNEASYRPSGLLPNQTVSVTESAEFALELWRTLEPSQGGFDFVGRHMLRLSFEAAFHGVEGIRPSSAPLRFEAAVDSLLASNNVDGPQYDLIRTFLLREAEPADPNMFVAARTNSVKTAKDHHLHVLARATLLLVVAAGATRRLFRLSRCSAKTLQFWWPQVGLDLGLWSDAPSREELLDLWDDVTAASETVGDWLADLGPSPTTRHSLLFGFPEEVARLSQLELAALWELAS